MCVSRLCRLVDSAYHSRLIANIFLLLGTGLIAYTGKSVTVPHYLYGYEVLLGFGVGGILVLNSIVVKLNALPDDSGKARWGITRDLRLIQHCSIRTRGRLSAANPGRQHRSRSRHDHTERAFQS
jgi:hypothetical protein